MRTYYHRVQEGFSFALGEHQQLLFTSIVAGFILAFRKWGVEEFNFLAGFFNTILAFIVVLGSLYLHVAAQKLAGLKVGYFPQYRAYPTLLTIGFILAFFTNGIIPFFPPGCLHIETNERMRLGKLRKGYTMWEASHVTFAGPLANIVLAAILGLVYQIIPLSIIYTVITINLLIAVYAMLPIPQFYMPSKEQVKSMSGQLVTGGNPLYNLQFREGGPVGLFIFMHSRIFFVLLLSLVVFYAGLIYTVNVFAIFLAFILSLVTTVIYYYLAEKS